MATGYKPVSTIYNINIVEFPGLLMRCGSISLGKLTQMQSLAGSDVNDLTPDQKNLTFRLFASKLISWNVQHPAIDEEDADGNCAICHRQEGDELPSDIDGMACLELSFLMDLIRSWINAIASIQDPKGKSIKLGSIAETNLMNQLGDKQSPLTLPLLK